MAHSFESVRIHHFSGTGASALFARSIQTFFVSRKLGVTMVSMASPKSALAAVQTGLPPKANPLELEVYVFPVHAFAAPDPCLSFVRRLPKAPNPALVIACHGGGPLGAAESFARRLESRGRQVMGITSPLTPAQWTQVGESPDAATVRPLLQASLQGLQTILTRMLDNPELDFPPDPYRATGPTRGIMRVVSFLYRKIGRHALGLLFAANNACNSCGICASSCPAGCITMKDRHSLTRPLWHTGCTLCNHCINVCPVQAIQCTWFRLASLIGINTLGFAGFILAATQGYLGLAAGAASYLLITFLQLTLGNRFLAFLESRAKAGSWLHASWTIKVPRYLAPKSLD